MPWKWVHILELRQEREAINGFFDSYYTDQNKTQLPLVNTC